MRHPNFDERHHQLLDELVREYEIKRPIEERAPSMNIQLGTHKSNNDLRKELEKSGHLIVDWAGEILDNVSVASEPTDVDLFVCSNDDLGLSDDCIVAQTYEAAQKLDLELCPAEVGPQLRLQYKDQPIDEWLLVAIDPISDRYDDPYVFVVGRRRSGRLVLDTHYCHRRLSGDYFDGIRRWVFVGRK